MKYINKNGIEFYTYMEGRLWVTDITIDNLKFRFNNSYDYFPKLETLDKEGLLKLLNIKEETTKEIVKEETIEEEPKDMEIIVKGKLTTKSKSPKLTTSIVEKPTTKKTRK